MDTDSRVIVIGGGPAGSTAATLLSGLTVFALEQYVSGVEAKAREWAARGDVKVRVPPEDADALERARFSVVERT